MILLTPGPCMTSKAVREALAAETDNHRSLRGQEAYDGMLERLRTAFSGYTPGVIPATGTAAVESMIISCCGENPRLLILANGYYSERTAEIARAHRIEHDVWKGEWLSPLDQEKISEMVLANDYSAVVVTHHETSTSRLNSLDWLQNLQSQRPFRLLVDAVSSVGADELGVRPDAFCLVPNKCFHGVTGLAVVMLEEQIVKSVKACNPHALFLDLKRYLGSESPGTVSVGTVHAFNAALDEWSVAGGSAGRREVYRSRMDKISDSLLSKGLRRLIDTNESSCSLSVWSVPEGFTSREWLAYNEQRGFALFPCKGELAEGWFQVSVMGEIPDGAIEQWLEIVPG